MNEHKIGELITVDGKSYKVVKAAKTDCSECAAKDDKTLCDKLMWCSKRYRKDETDVCYVEVSVD